jgi:hypothetical protein
VYIKPLTLYVYLSSVIVFDLNKSLCDSLPGLPRRQRAVPEQLYIAPQMQRFWDSDPPHRRVLSYPVHVQPVANS